jgi:hypothetical protein
MNNSGDNAFFVIVTLTLLKSVNNNIGILHPLNNLALIRTIPFEH